MSKYAEGNLRIILFGPMGEKLEERPLDSDLYVSAIEEGERLVSEEECSTFVISRILYNSGKKKRWEVPTK